jgi:hypothetical protein
MDKIKYWKGYKYQLAEDYIVQTGVVMEKIIANLIDTDFITLLPQGVLRICKGYAWDGPSGPTIDTKNFMRGSLVHDALYQLIRQGKLDIKWREQADKELKRICLEDGMSKIRAWYVYKSVRCFAKPAALSSNRKKVCVAP